MNDAADATGELPVWARAEAFPEAPSNHGWATSKGTLHKCGSLDELAAAIRTDRDAAIALVWTPDQPRLVLPEEVPALSDAILAARRLWALDDLETGKRRSLWFALGLSGFSIHTFYQGFIHARRLTPETDEQLFFGLRTVLASTTCGIALLMFLIFGFIPWYQARKRKSELERWQSEGGLENAIPAMRFETWLGCQAAPVTKGLLVLIAIVWLVQMFNARDIAAAGLSKPAYQQGEWWRLLTAPFLHGNIVHFLMNAAALLYLGKRLEVFARWPHLATVFLFSAWVGGDVSARFLDAGKIAVGASGGLMGWLGFLLVFETLHSRLVPRSSRRRLLAGVLLTALIGMIGYRFIDNAAHAGGLVAGMFYAAVVFPKSASPHRPRSTFTDLAIGSLAILVAIASAALAAWKILAA